MSSWNRLPSQYDNLLMGDHTSLAVPFWSQAIWTTFKKSYPFLTTIWSFVLSKIIFIACFSGQITIIPETIWNLNWLGILGGFLCYLPPSKADHSVGLVPPWVPSSHHRSRPRRRTWSWCRHPWWCAPAASPKKKELKQVRRFESWWFLSPTPNFQPTYFHTDCTLWG